MKRITLNPTPPPTPCQGPDLTPSDDDEDVLTDTRVGDDPEERFQRDLIELSKKQLKRLAPYLNRALYFDPPPILGESLNQCDYFGWFGWFSPLDFLANPLDSSNFGWIGWIFAVLAGFIQWISFPIHWNILKIITLVRMRVVW